MGYNILLRILQETEIFNFLLFFAYELNIIIIRTRYKSRINNSLVILQLTNAFLYFITKGFVFFSHPLLFLSYVIYINPIIIFTYLVHLEFYESRISTYVRIRISVHCHEMSLLLENMQICMSGALVIFSVYKFREFVEQGRNH